MTGAILSWGCEHQSTDDLLRLVQSQRITLVVDQPRPRQPGFRRAQVAEELQRTGTLYQFTDKLGATPDPDSVAAIYAAARAGNRVLVLGHARNPDNCSRGPLLAAIAREARIYALSAMARVIQPIEIGHIVSTAGQRPGPKARRWRTEAVRDAGGDPAM